MSLELQERVIKIISDIVNVPVSELDEHSSPTSVPQWESMKHINLVLALEEEFDLQFDDEQITELQSVKGIIDTINAMK
jgi:acyl carrier protein